MSFTAVVVLHDSRPDLGRLLASLARYLRSAPQLVVVDTGSQDGGPDLAERHGAEVIRLEGNPGFGAANNAGVARARHDVTVLLNPDVELLDGGLAGLVAQARAREGLHVPRLLNADGSIQRSAHPVPGRAAALLPALVHPRALPARARLAADPWRAPSEREVGWAIAAALAARTATLRGLGPFDPEHFLFYEDLDLCLRARAVGVPTVLHPTIALRHAGGHSTRPAFGGEPLELLARRRRAIVGGRLGARALALDDAAQAATFATRWAARCALRRDAAREAAQLAALRAARRSGR
jgi:N-acetylglucosaminyl-diphospho-decaprenol L-rhamnosyltransferase